MSVKPKILIVDDEEGIRESLSSILRDEQYSVDAVGSAEEALERISGGDFEVVLLDVWLPGMDGLETLGRIQSVTRPPEVIMISGHGTIETAVRATKLGAFDFIEKPLSLEKIIVLVRNAVQQHRLEDENSSAAQRTGPALSGHRRKRADESAAPANRRDCPDQRPRPDLWRERHRQGTRGARAARRQPAQQGGLSSK